MKPLREQLASEDALVQRAAELVAPLGPLPESRLRMRRVRLSLDRPAKPRHLSWLRPALVFGMLFGGIATAGATWGVVSMVSDDEAPPVAPLEALPLEALPPKLATAPRTGTPSPPRVSEVAADSPELDGDVLAETPLDRKAKPASSKRRLPAQRKLALVEEPPALDEPDPARSAVSKMSDSILVHQAVKVLRSGGDAAQAASMLERYRAKNPDGVLAEEALALSIEAAVQQKDPRAKLLAQQYLAQYPSGRFAATARRASR